MTAHTLCVHAAGRPSEFETVDSEGFQMNTLYVTGAGVSADSGIPRFRGSDGFWTK